MKRNFSMKRLFPIILLIAVMTMTTALSNASAAALSPTTSYTVTIQKIGSDGTPGAVAASASATTDANGLLTFSFTSIPTNSDANFLLLKILDGSGVVVKQALVPAPPASAANFMGINDMSDTLASALLTALAAAQTDDPILTSYALMMLRSSIPLTSGDLTAFGQMGKKAIIASGIDGTPSMEEYLTGTAAGFGNISSARLTKLKACLIYNNYSTPTGKGRSLRDFARSYYDSNNLSGASAQSELQKAGGRMADIFMDAALCAGIPAGKIMAAHDAAGDVANPLMGTMSDALVNQIQTAASAFGKKFAIMRITEEYTQALSALGATGAQVARFIQAVKDLQTASAAIDITYTWFFNNPTDANAVAHSYADANTVRAEIDTHYSTIWTTFSNAIQSTNQEISDLRTLVATTLAGGNASLLPPGFGAFYNMDGSQTNWSIAQTVMVSWIATAIQNGGTFTYTRDTLAIPNVPWVNWMGNCSKSNYYDQTNCTANGGIWTVGRTSFGGPQLLSAFSGLQQDVQIVDAVRNTLWYNTPNPTSAQRRASNTAFETNLQHLESLLGGTKDATGLPFSAQEKHAIIKLMLQPNDN